MALRDQRGRAPRLRARALLDVSHALQSGQASALLRAQRSRLTGLVGLAEGNDPELDLRAALTGFGEYGAPFYLARTRLELGRWLLGQGRGDEAAPLLEQARAASARTASGSRAVTGGRAVPGGPPSGASAVPGQRRRERTCPA